MIPFSQTRAMCQNPTCPVRANCGRHAEGGASPTPGQSYLIEQRYGSQGCDYYEEVLPEARAA